MFQSCPIDISPGKNTGVSSHSLPQGILPDSGIEPQSPALQVDSLPSGPPGKPYHAVRTNGLKWKYSPNTIYFEKHNTIVCFSYNSIKVEKVKEKAIKFKYCLKQYLRAVKANKCLLFSLFRGHTWLQALLYFRLVLCVLLTSPHLKPLVVLKH